MAWAEGHVHSPMLLVCASKVIHAKDLAPRDLPEFEFTFFQQTASRLLEGAEWNRMAFGAKMRSVMEASLGAPGRERE